MEAGAVIPIARVDIFAEQSRDRDWITRQCLFHCATIAEWDAIRNSAELQRVCQRLRNFHETELAPRLLMAANEENEQPALHEGAGFSHLHET